MRVNLWKVSTLALAGTLALVTGGNMIRSAEAEDQPHMRAALVTLKTAAEQLEKATPDKGGHRVKAMALTAQAIDEVKAGIEFDNKH
jgi:hypothetical protein